MPFKSLLTWPPKPRVIWASHSLHLSLFLSLSDNILTTQTFLPLKCYFMTHIFAPLHSLCLECSSLSHLSFTWLNSCMSFKIQLTPNLFEKLSWLHSWDYPICYPVLTLSIFLPRTFHTSSEWMNNCIAFVSCLLSSPVSQLLEDKNHFNIISFASMAVNL